ncbi:MAG TPA: NADPH-dependent oxidoreductase [Clostridiales bacterium]|nr:NADPH-dependent oxidoreductase [Clostridiales bacterium]
MNYLLINGSPRKGNTWMLVELIKNEIQAMSAEAVFDEIHLADLELPFCTGCSLCFRKGHEHCPHNKTMREVISKIDWSDGVIFATTTFNMQPAALTKNFIDHLCFMLHRPYFFTKKAIVISTVGGVGAKKAVQYTAGTLRGIGFNRCYEFPVVSYSYNAYEINEKTKNKCVKMAVKFHNDVASKEMHAPSLALLIPYNIFRGMSPAYAPGTEYESLDGIHWTEPVRAKKVYDPSIPVPLYKKPFGGLFYAIGKMASKYAAITYRK